MTQQDVDELSRDYDELFVGVAKRTLATARKDLEGSSALEAELWVGQLVGTWQGQVLVDGADPVMLLGSGMIDVCARVESPLARVFCEALAVIVPHDELRSAARQAIAVLESRRVRVPRWATGVGQARYVRSMIMDHELDDGHSIFNAFAYPGGDQHTVSFYIDNNMGGLVKDFFPGPSLAQIEATLRTDGEPGMTFKPIDPAEARARIDAAYRQLDLTLGAPVSEDVHEDRLFAEARLAQLPVGGHQLHRDLLSVAAIEKMVEACLASPHLARAISRHHRGEAEAVVRLYFEFAGAFAGGNPMRISPTSVEVFLVTWLPLRLGVDDRTIVDATADMLNGFAAWSVERQALVGSYLRDIALSISGTEPLLRGAIDDRIDDDDDDDDDERLLEAMRLVTRAQPAQLSRPPDAPRLAEEMRNFDTRGLSGGSMHHAEAVAEEALRVCFDVLDPTYLHLAFEMIRALARKRPTPLTRGRPEIWAGGVLQLLGQLNGLWDAGTKPHVTAKDLAIHVGASPASMTAKAKVIREALGVTERNQRYLRPELLDR